MSNGWPWNTFAVVDEEAVVEVEVDLDEDVMEVVLDGVVLDVVLDDEDAVVEEAVVDGAVVEGAVVEGVLDETVVVVELDSVVMVVLVGTTVVLVTLSAENNSILLTREHTDTKKYGGWVRTRVVTAVKAKGMSKAKVVGFFLTEHHNTQKELKIFTSCPKTP